MVIRRTRSTRRIEGRRGISAAVLATLTLVSVALLGVSSGTASAQGAGGMPEERVVLALDVMTPDEARALARIIPDWEEAIAAGTRRVTVSRRDAGRVQDAGIEARIVGPAAVTLPPWPACYHRVSEAHAALRDLAQRFPELIEVIDIGDSWCKARGGCVTPGGDEIAGADLLVAKVTNRSVAPKQGTMWIDGALHARELPTIELMLAAIEHLVAGYGADPTITWLLDHRELHVGIASNPDGRMMVELGADEPYSDEPWLWRKNANPSEADDGCRWPPSSGNQYGIDLNRNHAFKWDAPGHSTNPCASTYRGSAPASEPEIQAYEDYVRSIIPDQRAAADSAAAPLDTTGMLINFHNATFPGTVLVPWGWTTDPSPNDAELMAIAERYADFNGYRTQYSLYPVSGNTRDWSYGELGIPSYVIELQGFSFVTECSALRGIIDQNLEAITMALGISDRPYERIRGPEVMRLPDRVAVRRGGEAVITARATELRSGDGIVAGVEAVVGRAGGAASSGPLPGLDALEGEGIDWDAVDGAWDERTETARLRLPVHDLPLGQHIVVVRAVDADGHWGPVAATFLEVMPPARAYLPALLHGSRLRAPSPR